MKRKMNKVIILCLSVWFILAFADKNVFAEQTSASIMQNINSQINGRTQNNVLEGAMPCRGEAHALVVYITLKDLEPLSDRDGESLSDLFFDASEYESGDEYQNACHSLTSYYEKASYGKLSISGTVEEYTTQKNSAEYDYVDEICREALDAVLADKELEDYDANQDGYLDAVYFLFSNGNFSYAPGNYVRNFEYEKVGYQMTEAVFIGSGYCTTIPTIAHETVHLMGLPDIYGGVGANSGGTYADTVMDGLSSDLPGIMKFFFGWIDNLVEISDTAETTKQLKSYSSNSELMVIYPNGDVQSKYIFLVEYITAEQCNGSLSYLGDTGGLRIWRVVLNTDENYEILGNSEIKAPGNSPYSFLETIHPYDEESFVLKEGNSFTPYSVPSSYYTTALYQTGGIAYCENRLYSGVTLTDIKFQEGSAEFQIEIEEKAKETEADFQYTVMTGRLDSIGENNTQEVVRITADTELYIVNTEGAYIQTDTEKLSVNMKVDYEGKCVRVLVSEETKQKLDKTEMFHFIMSADMIKNSYGCGNEETELEILSSSIKTLKVDKNAAAYNNLFGVQTFRIPQVVQDDDTTILAVVRNTEDGMNMKSSVYRLIKYDMCTNEVTEQEISSQLDGKITLCHDITDISLYPITADSFLVLTTCAEGYYFDLYQNNGEHLAENVIYNENYAGKVVYHTAAGEFGIGFGNSFYTVDFLEGISVTQKQTAGNFYGMSKLIPLNDGKMLAIGNSTVEIWDDTYVTTLELTEEEKSILIDGTVCMEENRILVFGYQGQDLVVNQYDMDFSLEKTAVVLEGIPVNESYRFPINVQKFQDEYVISFEAVPEDATISYANSYVYTVDLDGNVKSSYRYGDTTFGYHAGFYRMSEKDYILIESGFFQYMTTGDEEDTGKENESEDEKDTNKGNESGDGEEVNKGNESGDGEDTNKGNESGDGEEVNKGNESGNEETSSGSGEGAEKENADSNKEQVPGVGDIIIDSKTGAYYQITKVGTTNGEVKYLKPKKSKRTTISIPAVVKSKGVSYKVTAIAKKAFKNNKKIKKVTIGKNIKSIGSQAFYGCKKLKKIIIKTKKLSVKKVGKKAFKGIYSKAVVKVPKSKLKAYKKLLKKRGIGSKAKIYG